MEDEKPGEPHVNYFRISDFYRMFGTVIKSGWLFGNNEQVLVAELATLRKPEINFRDCVIFQKNFTYKLTESRPTTIWGGASKGVVFALLKARAGQPVSTVIDINPAKQGKYLPSTGLLVQSPSAALAMLPKGSMIYVMNSNYPEKLK